MKTTSNNALRRLASLLRESDEKLQKERGKDSLDDQIDSYFSDYELDSKRSKKEGRDFRSFVRRFLTEAEEDKPADEPDDSKKDDEKKADKKAEEQKKRTLDDIDIDNFVENVVRLSDNYDSLLEVRNTILRRAVNYLLDGYNFDVAESFKESLMQNHGIEIGKSKSEMEDDNFQPPAADRAGASPGGA